MKTAILFLAAIAAFAQVRDASPRVPSSGTVAQMNAISAPVDNMRFTITDALTSTDVSTGGGSTRVDAVYNGAAWVLAPSSGSGSGSSAILWAFWETSGMTQALTRYVTIGSDSGHTSESSRQQNLGRAGVLSKLYIRTITNVGGTAQTFIATVRINEVDTDLTCTINTGGSTCNDTVNTVNVSAGDRFSVKYVTSATETNVLYPSFTLVFE